MNNTLINKMGVLKVLVSNNKVDCHHQKINAIGMRIARNVPITIDFKDDEVMGYGYCEIEGDEIFVYIPMSQDFVEQVLLDKESDLWNYPCVGIEVLRKSVNEKKITIIQDFVIHVVSFCQSKNVNLYIKNLRTQFESGDARVID